MSMPFQTLGAAVMARYSRMDLINWWNDAFEELRWTGDFKRLCEQSQKDHGGNE